MCGAFAERIEGAFKTDVKLKFNKTSLLLVMLLLLLSVIVLQNEYTDFMATIKLMQLTLTLPLKCRRGLRLEKSSARSKNHLKFCARSKKNRRGWRSGDPPFQGPRNSKNIDLHSRTHIS